MPDLISSTVPTSIKRSTLDPEIASFLARTKLTLGGKDPYPGERAHHTAVLGAHNVPSLPDYLQSVRVETLIVPTPETGEVYVRCYHPNGPGRNVQAKGNFPALVYVHGGGWTVGSLSEFDTFFRVVAHHGDIQVYGIEYHLAPEWRYPTQLNEVEAVLRWLHDNAVQRGVDPGRIALGGDSAGGNMTAVTCLRFREMETKRQNAVPIALQVLLYPECKVPFETVAGGENCTGLYLETQGVLLFAWHMLPQGKNHTEWDITPLNAPENLVKGLPPSLVVTNGFDPLRDTGHLYAQKLEEAGNEVWYVNHEDLTHGFVQFTQWSKRALEETIALAEFMGKTLSRN